MTLVNLTIRAATVADAPRLLAVYAPYVEHTAITFEYAVPTVAEFEKRIAGVLCRFPYLVAEADGEVLGYAYAAPFHARAAYAYCAEVTVYLAENARGHGIGRQLYALLHAILKAQGIVNAIACITPPKNGENYPSMRFHQKMGYRFAGRIENSGYKFGRWSDTVYMEKTLNPPADNMRPLRTFDEVRRTFGL